jgi:hypothetical protein
VGDNRLCVRLDIVLFETEVYNSYSYIPSCFSIFKGMLENQTVQDLDWLRLLFNSVVNAWSPKIDEM